jgi:hypothetical protein
MADVPFTPVQTLVLVSEDALYEEYASVVGVWGTVQNRTAV